MIDHVGRDQMLKKCPFCEVETAAREWVRYNHLHWFGCGECKTGWLEPYESELKRTDPDVGEYYSQMSSYLNRISEVAREKAGWIFSEWEPGMIVLELGPGTGEVAGHLTSQNADLDYIAIEPNPIFQKILSKNGIQIHGGEPMEALREVSRRAREDRRKILLFMDNVLEHIAFPTRMLRELNQEFLSGSKLLIEVPNEAGIRWRAKIHDFLRGFQKPPTFPGHINLFTKEGLMNLLLRIPCKDPVVFFHPVRKKAQVSYMTRSSDLSPKVDLALFLLRVFPVDYLLGIPYWLRSTAKIGTVAPVDR